MIHAIREMHSKGGWFNLRSAVAHILHPKGKACLECGFLAFGTEELVKFDRTLLAVKGAAGLPDDTQLSHICCFRSLWVIPPSDVGEVLSEVAKRRRPCEGFLKYNPGYSPLEHRGLAEKRLERHEKIIVGIFAAIGGVLLTLLATLARKRLGL